MKIFSRLVIILLMGILLFSASGCDMFFTTFFEGWEDAHRSSEETDPSSENPTGIPEVDSVLSDITAMRGVTNKLMADAEELRAKGELDKAAKKMDAAIEKRPDDWTYHVSRKAIALEKDDLDTARKQDKELDRIHNVRTFNTPEMNPELWGLFIKREWQRRCDYEIKEMESINKGKMSPETKYTYYGHLSTLYWIRGKCNENESDLSTYLQLQNEANKIRNDNIPDSGDWVWGMEKE
ncbi:tetratricopeptide repeat protein [Chloroflexota bacterium]